MIIDLERFERVLDGLSGIINDIEDETLQDELRESFDALYEIYEGTDVNGLEDMKRENEVMRQLLAQLLSDEQKLRLKWKHRIDVDDGATGHEYII